MRRGRNRRASAVRADVSEAALDLLTRLGASEMVARHQLRRSLVEMKRELGVDIFADAATRRWKATNALEAAPAIVGVAPPCHRDAAGACAAITSPIALLYRAHRESSAVSCRFPADVRR